MKDYWQSPDGSIRLICGDCLDVLRRLPDELVQTCITSPPYWGLRDYGTAEWEGGNPACDHAPDKRGSRFATPVSSKQASNAGSGTASQRDCKCGARRIDKQLGLEPTPDEYVAKLVAVFREVRRVLREDGTVWLNLGDSYVGGGGYAPGAPSSAGSKSGKYAVPQANLKPKDLVGIPWRVAFALQADGWWLRQDIIWHKPNPMPESVTDRCTKAHEYIFLLAKSKRYYYDAEAAKEPNAGTMPWGDKVNFKYNDDKAQGKHGVTSFMAGGTREEFIEKYYTHGRNRRSVWTIPTCAYPAAHFATFPPKLIEPCIMAGAPEGGVALDPFAGTATVGQVCIEHKRKFIGIELSANYCKLAVERLEPVWRQWHGGPMFVEMPLDGGGEAE